jgi:catechol 2,3-dioxygenase-like lactoylglutathione lyase family enzyme
VKTRLAAALVCSLFAVASSADPEGQAMTAMERGDTPALREALAAVARTGSPDDAALLFAAAVERLPRNRAFRARFDAALSGPLVAQAGQERYLFVFVPGWLYRTNPDSGADFARPRGVLAARGYAVRLAEIDENATVEANGDALAAELERLAGDGRRLVLISTSKAGPETQLALDRLEREGKAAHVAAWVNIGGLLNGTAVADHWAAWPRSWLAAFAFAFMGHDTNAIPSMQMAPRRARFAELRVPDGVLVVNYIGAPRAAEITPGAQGDYAILLPHGPNDGLTLLADALVPQGVTVVERGLDHYFAAPDIDRRVAAMAQAVLETLADR